MSYTINRMIPDPGIDHVDARLRKARADHGLGVLTETDVKATMKKKLDVEIPDYRIFGACNPKMAHEAIGIEPRVGAMLPCNVILREVEGGVEIGAIDPVASMQRSGTTGCTPLLGRSGICWPRPSRRFETSLRPKREPLVHGELQ